nr:endosialidase [uncultured Mediterranean phage uvMED]
MANVIKHKRGTSDPTASDLVVGEVAIRTDVGKLFTKMDNGSVAEIAGGGSDIIINTLSSSSATGGGSATFNGSAYRFTLSQPPSVSAQQLLVSIAGVIQKPIAGSGQPSEGFSINGNDIILAAAPATGTDFFILTFKSLGVSEPADNTVTSAKIVDGAIVNADINASAAIDVSKLSGVFPLTAGSSNSLTGDLHFSKNNPLIALTDTNNNPDYYIGNINGEFKVRDTTNAADRLVINTDGHVDVLGNLDVGAGIDVTGAITVTGTVDGVDVAALSSTVSGLSNTTINNNADNRVITGSGTANTLNGESLLTYNTSTEKLSITRSSQSNVGYFVYHSDGNEAGHFSTIGSGNEGILVLKDGGTDTIHINGGSGGDSYFNTGKFTIGGAHASSSFGFTDGSLDVQGNDTTAFIDLGNPIPSHTNGTLPNLRLKSNCTSKTAEIQKIYGGDNNVYKHIEFNGRHTAIHDCYPANAEIARFTQNGLTFNGDTAAANAISDYEEGTFSFNESNISVSNFEAKYTKIGRVVMLSARLTFGTSSNTGVLNLTGLPFTPDSGAGNSTCGGVIPEQNVGLGALFMAVEHGNNTVRIRKDNGQVITPANASGKQIRFVLHYIAAS